MATCGCLCTLLPLWQLFWITVNAIAPGTVNTAMPRAAGVTDEQLFASGRAFPLGRIAEPEDIVPALLFLCGNGGEYMTGQVLHVTGGSFMPRGSQ